MNKGSARDCLFGHESSRLHRPAEAYSRSPSAGTLLSRDKEDARLYPIDTPVRQARDRLNSLKETLGGPHHPKNWPLRKVLTVRFLGSRALQAYLDRNNRVIGTATPYMLPEQVKALQDAAGWSDLGKGLVDWVWADSDRRPPDIEKIR